MELTVEIIREKFGFDPDRGFLLSKIYRSPVGHINNRGYMMVKISGKSYSAHRIIWALWYGKFPVGSLDHINGNKIDNRIINLREVTSAENARNRRFKVSSSSGYAGVYWDKRRNAWAARIGNGTTKEIGIFHSLDDAVAARKIAEEELGYTAFHGNEKPLLETLSVLRSLEGTKASLKDARRHPDQLSTAYKSVPRICEQCASEFLAKPCDVRKGWARFCSKTCSAQAQQFWKSRTNFQKHA